VVGYHAAKQGRRTLIVESGPYIRGAEMTHEERDMFPLLYKDGALQMNAGMDMFILQGAAVGGSTVLANMVMFRTPKRVLEDWRAFGAVFEPHDLERSFETVERALGVTNVPNPANVSSSSKLLMQGAAAVGISSHWMSKAVGACVGCGGCNIGCVFDHKRSALTTYIPWAIEHGARVLADTTVTEIEWRRGQVSALRAVHRNGEALKIVARQFVVACGAIGTPGLLLKNKIRTNVGTRVSFNVGALLMLDFPKPIDDFDGDQMTAYAEGDGFTIESVAQPPLSAALSTPGWFGEHAQLMREYRHHSFATSLVATKPVGRVSYSRWFGHAETQFNLPEEDLATLRRGLKATARIFFAAGARRIFLPSQQVFAMHGVEDLGMIDRVMTSPRHFNLGTAHPQGGMPWSDDPKHGAVDRDFRLHGFANLYACDASVFPTSVGVNPAESVMAVADYGAQRILSH
jgi:choline dehydrogenase-like flavoprotein